MAQVRLSGGKPILVGGKVALSDDCCCGGDQFGCTSCLSSEECSLPDGNCPHALCLTFKAVRPATIIDDEYWDRGSIAELDSDLFILPYLYYNGEDEPANEVDWVAGLAVSGVPFISIETPMTLAEFFGNSHDITVQASNTTPTNWLVEATAYGEIDTDTGTVGTPAGWSQLFIGSDFAASTSPICLCGIQLLANPHTDEEDFIFPADSFDSSVGSGQSIDGGTVMITGDASGGKVGYLKDLDPVYDLICDCCGNLSTSYPMTGSVTLNFSDEIDPGFRLDWDGTATFSGSLVHFVNTFPTIDDPCTCTSPPDCNPIDDCPANFTGNCFTHTCTVLPSGPVTNLCDNPSIEVEIKCVDGDGWYLRVFVGGPDFCGGQVSWITNFAGDNYVKITDCQDGPMGTFGVTLDSTGLGGTASATITITA